MKNLKVLLIPVGFVVGVYCLVLGIRFLYISFSPKINLLEI